MRSLTLDTTSFTPNLVNLLRLLPNNISNSVWEAVSNPHAKPVPQSPYEDRLKYITAKYVDRAFVEPLPLSTTANELLLKSITKGDLRGVLWALASKANPNGGTATLPAILLALLQEDKPTNPQGKPDSGSSTPTSQEPPNYPIAELLVLNGATPIEPKSLPAEASNLSEPAKQYLQAKADRVQQNLQSPPPQYTTPSKSTTGLGISSNPPPSSSSGVTSLGDLNRTVSKLQKRLSAGGKTFRTQERDTEGK
jgi:Arf-GAP/SH3 domain/ANK repeat/PH domain-containing protein